MNQQANCLEELKVLAAYLEGYSDAMQKPGAEKIQQAARWLRKLEKNICGAGYIGCHGGDKCTTEHK